MNWWQQLIFLALNLAAYFAIYRSGASVAKRDLRIKDLEISNLEQEKLVLVHKNAYLERVCRDQDNELKRLGRELRERRESTDGEKTKGDDTR